MSKPCHNKEAIQVTSLVALTQTAIGCGVGLLLAGKLGRTAQRTTAIAVLSVGVASTLPLVYGLISKRLDRPESARGQKRRLDSIRQDSGFGEDAQIF